MMARTGGGSPVPRRVLLDMHVPDWDPTLLASWDPVAYVEAAARAGASEVTLYAQSHLGLAYWPAPIGPVHAASRGRDWVAEGIDAARSRGLAVRGYYSLTQNNWAYREQPSWRTTGPLREDGGYPGPRYGLVCFRNPDYRSFTRTQVTDLVRGHVLDSMFFDLTLFSPVCSCPSCAQRFVEADLGAPLTVVDWRDPRWWAQRSLAERDAVAWAGEVTDLVHAHRPGLPVQHNFTSLGGLAFGGPTAAIGTVSHPAADFYGDLSEQLAVASVFDSLTEQLQPPSPSEFMTSISLHVTDGVELKDVAQLEVAVALAVATNGAPTLIDAVRPDGTVNSAQYDALVAPAFAIVEHARWHPGDEALADVGLFYSDRGRLDEADTGRPAHEVVWGGHSYPHFQALKGAARALASAHVPFRVVTTSDLEAGTPPLVVVPNTAALGRAEREALVDHARRGGVLYVSADTGSLLVDDDDVPAQAAGMASLVGLLPGVPLSAVGPAAPDGVTAFASPPPAYLRAVAAGLARELGGIADGIRVDVRPPVTWKMAGDLEEDVEVLVVFDLPAGDRVAGVFEPRGWVGVHHDPPFLRGVAPAVVRRRLGHGSVLYSSVAVEEGRRRSHVDLFVALVRSCLPDPAIEVDGQPEVWVFARRHGAALVVRVVDTDDRTSRSPGPLAVRLPGRWTASTRSGAELVSRCLADPPVTELRLEAWHRFVQIDLIDATEPQDAQAG